MVQRYYMAWPGRDGWAEMIGATWGDYVEFEEHQAVVAALQAKIEVLAAENQKLTEMNEELARANTQITHSTQKNDMSRVLTGWNDNGDGKYGVTECEGCGGEPGEAHTCPYKEDVWGDRSLCNCCDTCVGECAADI